ncbi:hypothetical protein [Paracoccus seriniphilus]|uniref:hypothetical protein n=1 Tax=Paracoccus seriniphilus TaxID=184748 RepID=UPI0035695C60
MSHRVTSQISCSPVEAPGADLGAIRIYLSNLLDRFEASDGFGIGCLVGNTLTQIPAEDVATREKLLEHCARLTEGFRKVLTHENGTDGPLTASEIDDLARYTMISVQGLWSYSRLTDDAQVLRAYSDRLVESLEARLRGAAH